MVKHLLVSALAMTLLFAAVIGLIRAQPYDDGGLRELLTPPQGCAAPCFMGLRPGATTRHDALEILNDHTWVAEVIFASKERIVFSWSRQHPPLIDVSQIGEVFVGNDSTISGIQFRVDSAHSDTRLAMGRSDRGDLFLMQPNFSSTYLSQWTLYPQGRVWIRSVLPCPLDFDRFWRAPVDLVLFGDPANGFLSGSPYNPAETLRSFQHASDCNR